MNSLQTSSLVQAVEDVLRQGQVLLAGIDSETYARKLGAPFHSAIGGHYRHVLDHFASLRAGLRFDHVDYDSRQRNTQVETDVAHALAVTDQLIEDFRRIPAAEMNNRCTVAYSVGYTDEHTQSVESTLGREVAFCVGHAIHHYAIMRLICAQLMVNVPVEFGIAPSTLKYQRATTAR